MASKCVHIRLALLALALTACGEVPDTPFAAGSDADEAGDEAAADESDDVPGAAEDDRGAVGSVRDAGSTGRDAAASQRADAASADAGSEPPRTPDDGGSAPDGADARVPDSGAGEAPLIGICEGTASWDAQATAFEDEVLRLTNEARAAGHDCDTKGVFNPTAPVVMEARLRCAARLHSKHMATTGDFAHDQSATGKGVDDRLRDVGYRYSGYGENIAYGQRTPAEVVAGWLESDGHCAIMMSPSFKQIGIGYATRSSGGRATPYWTQDYGTSR